MDEDMRPYLPKVWQCVLICWGTKYGAADVNRLVKRVADQNSSVARFVRVSDRQHLWAGALCAKPAKARAKRIARIL